MKHDLIDGRRGTYFGNAAGDYNAHCVLTRFLSKPGRIYKQFCEIGCSPENEMVQFTAGTAWW